MQTSPTTRCLAAITVALAGCAGGTSDGEAASDDPGPVHGVAPDPDDPDAVVVATHTGLLRIVDGDAERVGEDATFGGVTFQDREESPVAFLDELGRGYEHYIDPGTTAATDFGVFGIPGTYVIEGDGTVVARLTGEVDYPLLSTTLDDVLAGREPGSVVRGPTQSQPGG